MKKTLLTLAITLGLTSPVLADNISIVGSSTVFPFASSVSENFGQRHNKPSPVIESTGSGGGFKLFCKGVGQDQPDITNSSRAIKNSEKELCASNGVTPLEVKIGYDGIVIATAGSAFNLTLEQIYLALAKDIPNSDGNYSPNTNTKWSDVGDSLSDVEIDVLGPPPTSGTRDAFVELGLETGCVNYHKKLGIKLDKKTKKAVCHAIREDGVYIDAGENDNLIVNKLTATDTRLGIFGFSFLDNNSDRLSGLTVEGIAPEFENISNKSYPISRSLYFYVKQEHMNRDILAYVREFVSDSAIGEEGYLIDKGLIPLSDQERKELQEQYNK